ncbi:aspartate kinase, partial [bacterium]|nr:aspartate kinase [bacterium]
MKVCKFGGSSVASAEQIDKVCQIVQADCERRIVVVSAPGKRHSADTKVTDLLIRCAEEVLETGRTGSAFEHLVDRFREIQETLDLPPEVLERIRGDLRELADADRSHPARYLDGLKAAGEDSCAKIVAAALNQRGLQAVYVSPKEGGLLLSDEFGNARVLTESYENLSSLKDRAEIVVFPGFFGYTKSGEVATFPRGGSDITGAILAAAVQADLYENFTDVDSVFAADPRLVESPRPIEEMTYREMRELSYAGFGVFHAEAVLPAVQANVPISIKNTNRPDAAGTHIVPRRDHTPGDAVGIASSSGFCSVFIEKFLMNRMVGFGRRVLEILEKESLSLEHMPSGIDSLSVILNESEFRAEVESRV